MSRINESLLWREFDRLMVFVFAYNEMFFTRKFLGRMWFKTEVSLDTLLEWAERERLIVTAVQRVVYGTGPSMNQMEFIGWRFTASQALRRWRRRSSRRYGKRIPFTPARVEDVVRIGIDDNTGQPVKSSFCLMVPMLRRFKALFIPVLEWMAARPCILYNPATQKLEPDGHGFDVAEVMTAMQCATALAIVTPLCRCRATNDILWRVLIQRAREIEHALTDSSFMPKGDMLEEASASDLMYQSFYGADRMENGGFIGATTYRLILRHLRDKPGAVIDCAKDAEDTGLPLRNSIITDLMEAGAISPNGEEGRFDIKQGLLARVLDVVYHPDRIPFFFGMERGQINFLGQGGPSEKGDVAFAKRWSDSGCTINNRRER